ncbi:DUF6998 domain-containing protein [Sporosarcina jiandibaonis]|uniref:DUF6998 domain-containing protein n=1 Tax=Sporosarcina jiandibaonis TaxID=2715535 RepID=UPI0015578F10|nr:hypothetical protein [Sporosarcina jiandibaonis]
MALTQMQIIQSLGEAMSWLEREISWGASPAELTHLMGRIGELYVAMYTNGNMADNVNEKGYDVVTKDNERISVKTTSMSSGHGHVSFNPNTLQYVDRVIILRFNADEMELEILLDKSIEEAKTLMTANSSGKLSIAMSKIYKPNTKVRNDSEIAVIKSATYRNYEVREIESGTIEVYDNGEKQSVIMPVLKVIAGEILVPLFNSKGNPFNTRQLGTLIIKSLNQVDVNVRIDHGKAYY